MLLLVIIIFIFARHAKELSLNPLKWSLFGLASYYIPQILSGLLLAAYYSINDTTSLDSSIETGLSILSIIPSVIITYYIYQKMPYWASSKQDQDDDLLDNNSFLGRQ